MKSKLRCLQIRCLVAARFLGHRWLSLCCVSHSHGRRARRLSGGLEGDLHSVSRVLHPGRHWLIRKHFGDNLSPAAKLPKFPSVSHLLMGCGPEVSHAGSTSTSVTHQPVSPMREKTLAGQVLVLFLICVIKATDSICCYNCATLNIIILFLEPFMLLNFCWITSLLGYMRPSPERLGLWSMSQAWGHYCPFLLDCAICRSDSGRKSFSGARSITHYP